jgi:adenine-specific DNA-methyltransferase
LFKGAKQSNTADGGLIVQEEINKNKDITANSEQLAALKAQFPSCFDKDGRFRPDKLEDIVRASGADITREGYKLDWLGKSYARLLANLKTETLLAPNAEHNALPENADSENLLIQGDNLDVLKHLVNAYSEKVKMIYIDPPYNTGSDGFVYNDTRKFTVEELQRLAGVEEDEAQRILDFTQSLSNSHSAWLTFMYPRLYVARELLRENGVIFISIDDNEQAQLKLLCDEVFGEENFVAQFVWAAGRKNDSQLVSVSHETILTYVKSRDLLKSQKTKWSQRKRGIDAIYAEAERLTAELESYNSSTEMV